MSANLCTRWLDKNQDKVANNDFSWIDTQSWDPAVKALARFPSIVRQMSQDLGWTIDLGDAEAPQDVADVFQELRTEGERAGTLKRQRVDVCLLGARWRQLAHEQAAAYCDRLGVSLSDYRKRFEGAPARLLDAAKYAPTDYHGGLTVSKSFALAIDEAAKLHPAAEPLITYAALLAPVAIPLFLFSEAREEFGEPLASQLEGEGLDEAIGALRDFALVDRETIADERDPAITTETIKLHRLVRTVAAERFEGEVAEKARRVLIEALAMVYPRLVFNDPSVWPRARLLDAVAVDLVAGPASPPIGTEENAGYLLDRLASYRQRALGSYVAARPLVERALAIREKALGPEHPSTAVSLDNLAHLLRDQGDLAGARPLVERALAIYEKALGPEHPDTATSLNNLAHLLRDQGDLAGARRLFERALAIYEKALGPEHPNTATSLNNLANLLRAQGDLAGARPLFERALAIHEKALGPEHPDTAASLDNLAHLLRAQGDLAGARPLFERGAGSVPISPNVHQAS